ncbi:hypothetical protein V5O48_002103 [Marasmius crinis-equi]|uniref:Uncharacterized protein n=1 Tax=Marasmius crinis-equi TaxID=585013 RepID=A0ABR3FWP4_9AGAR
MSSKSLSPSSSKSKLTYSDTVLAFNDDSLVSSLNDACQNLARSSVKLMKSFEAISSQLNSLDAQTHNNAPPLRPRWSGIHRLKDFTDIVRQHRVSAGLISGRIKMLYGLILPMVTRNPDRESDRSRNEKINVLKSYINISSDHAAFTYTLAENALRVTSKLNTFHTEFAKNSCQGDTSGQKELRDLTYKLSELEGVVEQLCSALGKSSQPDASILAFTVLRISGSGRLRPTRRSLTSEKVALSGTEAAAIADLFDQLESAHNELAHIHYSVEVTRRRTDLMNTTRTAMSTLVSDEILNIQAGLSLFLAIWASLRTECMAILDWLQNRKKYSKPPACVETYLATGYTLYSTLAGALDVYIDGLDPSHFPDGR